MNTAERLRDEFISRTSSYEAFAECVYNLLSTLLADKDIRVHSITRRVKDPQSLYKKIMRPGKQYEALSAITDLVGLRIITHLPEEVDKVAEVIEGEFSIDRKNSVDKRLTDHPDRFGYGSVHKICSLNDSRVALPEYAKFSGIKCEIQLRTILQHAWAEIEHDLGYKSTAGVPLPLKRRFSRVAALLETADEEFMRLKKELTDYGGNIRERVMMSTPGTPLDRITLKLFIETDNVLRQIEESIRWTGQTGLTDASPERLDKWVELLQFLGISHVDSLGSALERHQPHIIHAVNRCEQVDYGTSVCQSEEVRGWSVWTLIQLLCAERPTREETIESMKAIGLWIPDSMEAYADSLRAIVRSQLAAQGTQSVKEYKSVYVTIQLPGREHQTFPLERRGDYWMWENITLMNERVCVDGNAYPIQSKNPLFVDFIHKGIRYVITW